MICSSIWFKVAIQVETIWSVNVIELKSGELKMKINKRWLTFVLVGVIAAVSTGSNAYEPGHIIEVPVVSSSPVYQIVRVNTPREECWQEAVTVSGKSNSDTPEILGAIVGAGVGRLFGSGRGQDAATVAGAILGGSIGSDLENKNSGNQVQYQQRCRTVNQYHDEERLQGYEVTFKLNDRLYTTRTRNDPGSLIKVNFTISPVE